jgi:hypothetical protein
MPYIMTCNTAITLRSLGKIKKKTQDAKYQSNSFKKKNKMDQGGCSPNVSPKEDPVGAVTIKKLNIIIREHQIIMLVNEGGHSHMRHSPLTDSLQICQ